MTQKIPELLSSAPETEADGTYAKPRAEEILDIALDMGVAMLECGAEVHRVEDTMTRICKAYGACEIEVFAITSLIVAQIRMPDETYSSQTRRILHSRNHLARLEELNALSREICREPLSYQAVNRRLDKIHRYRPVPEWLCYVGGMLATGCFAVFFGGTWLDGLAAAAIGFIITLIERCGKPVINAMASTFINAFIAGALALLCVAVGFGHNADMVIIGTIMLEIPGMAFGNALRDMLCGDTLAGAMRFIQAILQALIMAAGYLGAMMLIGQIPGV
ncbi:MAG: threonine/serine exporter family protein [Clostridia bacterium]|nr:threonine/serine exporter family protein [Clostridia bacterium]